MLNNIFQKVLAESDGIELKLPGGLVEKGGASALVNNITDLVFAFIGLMAFIGIVYSGIMMITSGGDASKFEVGKKNLLWSIIGIIVITLSYFIIRFVYSFGGEAI